MAVLTCSAHPCESSPHVRPYTGPGEEHSDR